MELTILTKEQFEEIIIRLDALNEHLLKLNSPYNEKFIDNQEFLLMMKISKRTAQSWRDQGRISFSQIGNKIYYRVSDIENFFERNYKKSFIDRRS